MIPHANPLQACMTIDGLRRFSQTQLDQAKKLITEIKHQSTESQTWDTAFGALDNAYFFAGEAGSIPNLLKETHPDAAMREVASEPEKAISEFFTELTLDREVFTVLETFAKHHPAQPPHRARFMNEVLTEFKRNGLMLDTEKQQRLRELNKELTNLSIAFDKHLTESPTIKLKPEQLDGLSDTFKQQHPVDTSGYVTLTTDTPDYIPFMRDAKDRDAAYDYAHLREGRSSENLPILKTMLERKQEKAQLLSYAHWADYVLEPRMAKNALTVKSFLNDLHTGLMPLRDSERALYNAKAKELNLPHDTELRASDIAFLLERLTQERFALDAQHVSEYFEVSAVKNGLLSVIEELYDVQFRIEPKQGVHEEIETYTLIDHGEEIGTLHLDLYPRPNKYKHMAMFGMRSSKTLDGIQIRPIVSLVCNFPRSTNDTPGLLTHDDVCTFFHEMGHAMHGLLGQTELKSQSGTNVAWDFVEVPSQLFENWAWDKSVLDRFARHYKTGELLPQTIFNSMKAARTFGEAVFNERQLFLASYDHILHTSEVNDTTKLYNELYSTFLPFKRPTDTSPEANFGHLNGYDAAYYSYQWALAIAHDIATRFEQEGYMNKTTGAAYRQAILTQGDSADGYELVERFLGRKPSNEAYKRYLGLTG